MKTWHKIITGDSKRMEEINYLQSRGYPRNQKGNWKVRENMTPPCRGYVNCKYRNFLDSWGIITTYKGELVEG